MSAEPELNCYYHPTTLATSQCDRCGDYLCGYCVQVFNEEHLCDRCFADKCEEIDNPPVSKLGSLLVLLAILTPVLYVAASEAWGRNVLLVVSTGASLLLLAGCSAFLLKVRPVHKIFISLTFTNSIWLGLLLDRLFRRQSVAIRWTRIAALLAVLFAILALRGGEGNRWHRILTLLAPFLVFLFVSLR